MLGSMITKPGILSAALLFLRVSSSAVAGFLLVLTTPWQDILRALRKFAVPPDFVTTLGMMWRYLAVLVYGVEERLWAKRSRTILPDSNKTARGWIGAELGMLWRYASFLGEEVALAMKARGYSA